MMRSLICCVVFLCAGGLASAQEIGREELRRVPVPGSDTMEAIVVQLTVPPGATIPFHSHPGDEHGVAVTPAKAQTPDGTEIRFEAGQSLYFPEGMVHGGLTNAGDTDMVAITTFIVRVGEPLIVLEEE